MLTNWGRPFRLVSPLVNNTSRDSTPIQVECGWTFTAVLTKSGDVLVWWPAGHGILHERITSKNDEMDQEGDKKACATEDGVIPCVTWDLEVDPVRLPALPPLPHLTHRGEPEKDEEPRLVQLAGLDNFILGLTQHGHVLKILVNENSAHLGIWEYVSSFHYIDNSHQNDLSCSAADVQ